MVDDSRNGSSTFAARFVANTVVKKKREDTALALPLWIDGGWEDGTSIPNIVDGDWEDLSNAGAGSDPGSNPLTLTNVATPTISTYTPGVNSAGGARSVYLENPYSSGGDGYNFYLKLNDFHNLIDISAGCRVMCIGSRAPVGTTGYTRIDLTLRSTDEAVTFASAGFNGFGDDTVWIRDINPTDGNRQTNNTSPDNYSDTTPFWVALGFEIPAAFSGTMKARVVYHAKLDNGPTWEASQAMSENYDYASKLADGAFLSFLMQKRGDAQGYLNGIWVGSLTDDWPI